MFQFTKHILFVFKIIKLRAVALELLITFVFLKPLV